MRRLAILFQETHDDIPFDKPLKTILALWGPRNMQRKLKLINWEGRGHTNTNSLWAEEVKGANVAADYFFTLDNRVTQTSSNMKERIDR
ncbi:hypothetical protein BT93_F3296 [Corymbia citriodora subsp. variegata]|nr:hypothetical protein BT93_F3296 [Corymbia citriodora subsp. variegata]